MTEFFVIMSLLTTIKRQKSGELSMDLWHLNNIKLSCLFEHWTILFLLCFLVLILSILFTFEPTNIEKSHYQISKKHDQTYINLTNVFDVIGYVIGYRVWWDQIWLCTFTKYTKIYNNAIIYVNELILTPFSSLDMLNAKNLLKYIFRAIFRTSRRVCFPYFPKVALKHGGRIMLQYLVQALWNN